MPGDVATSVQKTKIKISLSQLTTFRWTLQEEVQQLKTMGYGGIGLWRPKVSEIGEYAAADILQSSGIDVCSLSFAGGFTGRHGISFHEAQADAREAISTARLLSAENVIVVSGSQSLHTTRHSRRLVREALRELSEFAMLQGVRLSVLPMKKAFSSTWTFLNTLDETLELLDEVNHASVGMVFDTYQLSAFHSWFHGSVWFKSVICDNPENQIRRDAFRERDALLWLKSCGVSTIAVTRDILMFTFGRMEVALNPGPS